MKKGVKKGCVTSAASGRPAGRPDADKAKRKGVLHCGIMDKNKSHEHRKDAMKNYSIHHVPGRHLTFEDRQILARDWNNLLEHGRNPAIGSFAREHGLAPSTWLREYKRGAVGAAIVNKRDRRRRNYNEYDPFQAQDDVNKGNKNKGAPMRVTNHLADRFAFYVLKCGLSPYDAVCRMKEEFPDKHVPCVRTWYYHIDAGDIAVKYGQTPYHPNRDRPKRPRVHPAKIVSGRLQLSDRPAGANDRTEPGHYEIDTVVSCLGGRGGLLVLIDRMTRKYFIAPIGRISQKAVNRALGKLVRGGTLGQIKSITSDNGCEFLNPKAIKHAAGCDVFYTRAYASWEKGSVENANRMARRWYPKGTDFSKCSRAEISRLQDTINSIHRRLLGGLSANQFAASVKTA